MAKTKPMAAAERSNPLRRKFDVVGKKRNDEKRRTSRSRSEAIHKRENTQLKEFEQSANPPSVFHDGRIGERDEALPELDKAILRQQREHMAELKRLSKYNLSDKEEGQNFHTLLGDGDFDEEVPLGDHSYEGKIALSKKRLSLRSSGPSETELPEEIHGDKSKKEVMSKVILKGKFYKAQKAKEKEEGEQLVDKLDSDDCCSFIPKQMNPKFEDNYINGIDYDPDRGREQMKKLKKRVKSEERGNTCESGTQ